MNTVSRELGSVKNEKLLIPSSKYPTAIANVKLESRMSAVTSLLLFKSFNEFMTINLIESEFTHSFFNKDKRVLCEIDQSILKVLLGFRIATLMA